MKKHISKINFGLTVLLFGSMSLFFYLSVYYLLPAVNRMIGGHVSIGYYVSAGLVFVILFVSALYAVKREGWTSKEIFERLRLKKLDKTDWLWTLAGILIIGITTGLFYFEQVLFVKDFTASPPFFSMTKLLPGDRWTLIIWCVVFFFNIVGEEIFWRGFILPGQEMYSEKYAWIMNSGGWLIFHIVFGINLIIMLLPIILLLPYIAHKRKNTTIGIIIHAVLNGPSFVMIALGVI